MRDIKINFSGKTNIPTAVFVTEGSALPFSSSSFSGKYLETVMIYTENNTLYIGVGKEKKLTPLKLKEIGATITKCFAKEKIYNFQVDYSAVKVSKYFYQNFSQGLALGTYSFSLKSKAEDDNSYTITLLGEANQAAVDEGIALASGVMFARDVTNLPANHLRPNDYAQKILQLLEPLGVECTVLNEQDLLDKKMNGIYLLGTSSEYPPCLVVMRYNNNTKTEKTALVGKGITFDTGGYSLKPSTSMETMNGDMGGSASVVGAIYALAKNKAPVNVVGIVALAENRISSGSLVPGDVYTSYDGQTIEVMNTDAEGRLVLADAVTYAVKDENAAKILDIATLTGAAVVAFSNIVAPTVCNDEDMFDKLKDASKKTGERYWLMPALEEYSKKLDSKVADMKNTGGREGGIITGGMFIGKFAKDTPWIHVDIAGTSWVDSPTFAYQTTGATGTAVDTLYYFCQED